MGKLTSHCDGCPKANMEMTECSMYTDTSWVARRGGCVVNKVSHAIEVKTVGQRKQGRKVVGRADLTNAGLFPAWNAIGIGWKSKVELSKKVASRTHGKGKTHCEASQFARYCAKYSRAQYHRNYQSQREAWARIPK